MSANGKNTTHLDIIRVKTPCEEDWEAMQGDDRVRFCGVCHQNVFNLSAMAKEEAEDLIEEHEGSLCVRFYQRPDGTLLSKDCGPTRTTHLQLLAHRATRWAAGVAGVTAAGLLGLGLAAQEEDPASPLARRHLPPVVLELLDPYAAPAELNGDELSLDELSLDSSIVMGMFAAPREEELDLDALEEQSRQAERQVRQVLDELEDDRGMQAILAEGGQTAINLAPGETPRWAQDGPGGEENGETSEDLPD